jgi:ribosomal protein S27AE
MTAKYGNLPLGQVYKLLISIIGRDTALTIAGEYGIPIIGQDLDKMFEEKDISFVRFRPNEKTSVLEIFRRFFELLENKEKYALPSYIKDFILNIWHIYRDVLKGRKAICDGKTFDLSEAGLIPYEMETSELSLLLLNWSLGYLGSTYENGKVTILKGPIKRLLKDTYGTNFNEIIRKMVKNDDDYEQLWKLYNISEKHDDDSNRYLNFKENFNQTIKRYCKGTTDITWKTLKTILDFVNSKGEKKLARLLIGLYLLKNTETALKEIYGIEQEDKFQKNIYQVKQYILKWAKGELFIEPQKEKQHFLMVAGKYDPADLSLLQEHSIDSRFLEQRVTISECGAYLWGKTVIEYDVAKRLIQTMKEKCPNCGIFFASWARARLAVLSCKFDGSEEDENFQKDALKSYHTAFDKGRNFAGAYLKAFLKESIAATVYFNRRRIQDIPKVIDTDKSLKTPITDDVKENEEKKREASYGAKQYYEYGYALNLFEQESSETYLLHFNAEEHFWKVFPTHQFINTEAASQKCTEDLFRAKGIHLIEGGKEELEQYLEALKQKLKNVSEKNINKRMEIRPGHNIQYTPLSIALQCGELDIAEHYLKDFAKTLDVTVINTNGSTALLETLTQYKNRRFFGGDEQKINQYKKIIMELIERSPVDSLYAETVIRRISVLEEAVNTFDIEIVKAIVDKKGFDINRNLSLDDSPPLHISADEFSPLYYVINRCYFLSKAISEGKISISKNANINWHKANFPGIFIEDKMTFYENIKSDPLFNNIDMEKLISHEKFGKTEIWKQEFMKLKEIVNYFIEKTDNVDKFVKINPEGDRTTALSLAIESNFDDICHLLIEKGASPALIFSKNGIPYDSPFVRAVWYKSWETLEILLTDFKENIKPIIDFSYREAKFTAAHLLFKVDYSSFIYKYSVNYENFKFIEHFIPLFRNAGAEFDIPDIGGITVRQILRENNLEHLIKT